MASASRRCSVGPVRARHAGWVGVWTGIALEIEQCECEVDVRDAVAERVVHLEHEPDGVVDDAVDEPHLPERSGSVERLRLQPAHEGRELLVVARARGAR